MHSLATDEWICMNSLPVSSFFLTFVLTQMTLAGHFNAGSTGRTFSHYMQGGPLAAYSPAALCCICCPAHLSPPPMPPLHVPSNTHTQT